MGIAVSRQHRSAPRLNGHPLKHPRGVLLGSRVGSLPSAIVDDHLGGASVMTLEWVEPTEHLPYETGARAHFHVRLLAGVLSYERDVDGAATIATHLGVVELERDGTMARPVRPADLSPFVTRSGVGASDGRICHEW